MENWPELHDATLTSIGLDWKLGELVLHFQTGEHPNAELFASQVVHVTCERQMPWGPSVSVNEIRGPMPTQRDGVHLLEVEMQSGDVIGIEAEVFALRKGE